MSAENVASRPDQTLQDERKALLRHRLAEVQQMRDGGCPRCADQLAALPLTTERDHPDR